MHPGERRNTTVVEVQAEGETTKRSVQFAALIVALGVLGAYGDDYLGSIAYVVALGTAALGLLRVAMRHPTQGRAWGAIGCGMTLWATAGALVTMQQAGGVSGIPALSISVLYAAGYVPMMIGLVMLGEPVENDRRFAAIADWLLMFTFIYGVMWLLVVESVAFDTSLPTIERAFSSFYPAGDLALVMLAVRLAASRAVRPMVSWLIVGGLVASAAADFALLALYLDNPSGSWPMADLAYLLGCGAIALAALSSPLVSKVARPTHPVSTSQLLPITVGVLAIVPPVLLFGIALRDQGAVRLLPVSIWLLVVTILAVCRGVAGRQVLNETMKQVQWYATHDPVTGMYERATFMDLASRGGTRERGGTVLYLDVDGFRAIGDQYGQEAVEVVLVEIADRLRQVLSDGALLARLSYDEFASFVRSSDLNRGRILAESVQTSMREPVLVGDVELFVSVSVGVAQVDGAVIDLAAGLRRAGLAMRHAKSIGPGGFAIDAELAGSPLPEDTPSVPRLRATSGSPTFA